MSSAQRKADAPVLRQPPFGNIQIGHDLDARSHGQGQMLGRRRHFIQSAVHAIADFEFVLEWFKVNVTRAVLYRLIKHQVYKLDDRRFIRQVRQVRHSVARRRVRHFLGDFRVGTQLLEDVTDAFAFFPVKLANGLFNLGWISHHHLNLLAGQIIQLINDRRIERVSHGDSHAGTKHRHRQALVHARG